MAVQEEAMRVEEDDYWRRYDALCLDLHVRVGRSVAPALHSLPGSRHARTSLQLSPTCYALPAVTSSVCHLCFQWMARWACRTRAGSCRVAALLHQRVLILRLCLRRA